MQAKQIEDRALIYSDYIYNTVTMTDICLHSEIVSKPDWDLFMV